MSYTNARQLGSDVLFEADYPHVVSRPAYENCNMMKAIGRRPRQLAGPEIHYGLIASGDRVMRSMAKRETRLLVTGDMPYFEMEAVGIAAESPSIVICGISDYVDSHMNDSWRYDTAAAAAAAASVKELLSYITPEQPSDGATPGRPGQGPAVMSRSPNNCMGRDSELWAFLSWREHAYW